MRVTLRDASAQGSLGCQSHSLLPWWSASAELPGHERNWIRFSFSNTGTVEANKPENFHIWGPHSGGEVFRAKSPTMKARRQSWPSLSEISETILLSAFFHETNNLLCKHRLKYWLLWLLLVCTSAQWVDLWVQLAVESKTYDHCHHHQNQLPIIWNTLGTCFWQGSGGAGWSVFVHRSRWIVTPRRAQRVQGAYLPEDLQQQLSLQEKLALVLEALPGLLSI